MNEINYTKKWINEFRKDEEYGHKRLKKIDEGYPQFEIDNELVDTVDFETFLKIEKDRLPLFVGTQFGLFPSMNDMPKFFNGEKKVAILSKSLLSGDVSGLYIHQIFEEDNKFKHLKIKSFKNNL